jgi:glutamate synthase domain-containing protein 3
MHLSFQELNRQIKEAGDGHCVIDDCFGQRFICSGSSASTVTINGTPGNALGAYLGGGFITVHGNAQDAVGDTMNDGRIVIHGSAGDALGYAMRGGGIFVKGNSGYRTGIHMKEYKDKKPVIVIGGKAGSFLGEYLAGGLIIVLGIGSEAAPVGNFTGTGMHGGCIFIRSKSALANLPAQVTDTAATAQEMKEIEPYIAELAGYFGMDANTLMGDAFRVLKPNARNPYEQLYTPN